jgi:uncharacterized membrane protein YbhN (UPF0104 family)
LTALTGVALLVGIAVHVIRNAEEIAQFRRLSAPVIAAAIVSQTLVQLFMNGALLVPLRSHLRDLGFWEFLLVRTGGLLASSVVPVAGGIAVRLAYLRRRGLTYADFTWATLVSNVLTLVAAAIIAVIATAVMWAVIARPPMLILGLTIGILLAGIAAVAVLQQLPRLSGRGLIGRWLSIDALSGFAIERRTAAGVVGYSLLRHSFNFLTFGLLYGALSRSAADVLTGGLVYALTSPVRMINITPGNVGVNEWVVAIVGNALSFDVTTGLLVAIVFRGVTVVGQALCGLAAWIEVEFRGRA